MATENSFYVTLPSNTKQYQTNTLSSFRIRLPQRLNLDGFGWEVALVEAIYPHAWNNYVSQEKLGDVNIRIAIGFSIEGKPYHYTATIVTQIPSKYYADPKEIVDAINKAVAHNTKMEYDRYVNYVSAYKGKPQLTFLPNFLTFVYHKDSNKVVLHINHHASAPKVRIAPVLAYILGFDRSDVTTVIDKAWQMETGDSYTLWAKHQPDMRAGLYSIYIYCDIVHNQIVGDALVPLLGKVPVSGEHDSIVHEIFNSPMYLPLVRSEIDTIEVAVKDDADNYIPFQYGKVVLTLHFRRRNALV